MMVTYNRLELTKRTLENLYANTKFPFNLVIVDNHSEDGTIEFLKELPYTDNLKEFRYKLNDENKGIAIGRNQTLKLANDLGTDWYVTIDNDVLVPDGWLTESVKILKANTKYGMIGVNMEGKRYRDVQDGGCEFQCKPQGNLGTACIVFPKSLHKMLGFFNTEYEKYAHEDADFGMRARSVGYQLGYINEMGQHIGEGEFDVGEYREFKNEYHAKNLPKFHENARLYMTKKKSVYIPYKDE